MNTRLILTSCAFLLGLAGIFLTFAPDAACSALGIPASQTGVFAMQLLGALYFAFAMLNWMSKGSPIGGIYNRPISVANFTHFLIGGLTLIKGLLNDPQSSIIIWIAGGALLLVWGII
jgi:hypothetical protein